MDHPIPHAYHALIWPLLAVLGGYPLWLRFVLFAVGGWFACELTHDARRWLYQRRLREAAQTLSMSMDEFMAQLDADQVEQFRAHLAHLDDHASNELILRDYASDGIAQFEKGQRDA
jgi:hypothetical protein